MVSVCYITLSKQDYKMDMDYWLERPESLMLQYTVAAESSWSPYLKFNIPVKME